MTGRKASLGADAAANALDALLTGRTFGHARIGIGACAVDTHFGSCTFGIAWFLVDTPAGDADLTDTCRFAKLRIVAHAIDTSQSATALRTAYTRCGTLAIDADLVLRACSPAILRFENAGTIKANAPCGTRLMTNIPRRYTAVIQIGNAELIAQTNIAAIVFTNSPRIDACTVNTNLITLASRFASIQRQTLAIDALFV